MTSYKFYWLISLIEEVEKGNYHINKHSLFAGMIANAWYTINYFNVSFGKQDQLQRAIKQLIIAENLCIDSKKHVIVDVLKSSNNLITSRLLRHFDGEVPYRFLSPWFPAVKGNKKSIYSLSQSFLNDSLYSVNETEVVINPKWIDYLAQNSGILKAFCYWHLSLYLQKHNPNVPDIPNKLIRPPLRNALTKQRKDFWDVVIHYTGPINCIYTQSPLDIGNYAVEHFVPYAFVSHDLLWNLIPADKSFNSIKCDKLPPIDRYFDSYFDMQHLGLKTILNQDVSKNTAKLLQDYLTLIPDINILSSLDDDVLKSRFKDNIQPLITIASNNGFEFMS
ncbi:HNH endonuclease domain-containing protein [Pedobacter sp. PWIIR3]